MPWAAQVEVPRALARPHPSTLHKTYISFPLPLLENGLCASTRKRFFRRILYKVRSDAQLCRSRQCALSHMKTDISRLTVHVMLPVSICSKIVNGLPPKWLFFLSGRERRGNTMLRRFTFDENIGTASISILHKDEAQRVSPDTNFHNMLAR